MKKMELLSPAGNMEALKAAIHAGCDAVYLAGKFFGARSYAGNFTNEELKEAIEYAHLYGVKVYITVNIIVYEKEVTSFLKYVDYLVSLCVDALIIQDLGMLDLLRKTYPDLELHASTQMNVHNEEGVKLLKKLGVKRVVLAREVDIETIKKIKKNVEIELEVFGHGALCVCYSGNCYMSYFIGGRSGNRGTCAQCCRQPYDIIENGKKKNKENYVLSTKDLNILHHLEKFISSGIDSLKIEGRMKRPEYVYLVTKIYRKAIDAYYEKKSINIEEEIKNLQKLFSRNFTKGFLFNEKNDHFTSSFRPNHKGTFLGKIVSVKNNQIQIKLEDDLSIQDGIRIINEKEDVGFTVTKMIKNDKTVKYARSKDIVTLFVKEKVSVFDEVYKTTDVHQIENIREQMKIEKKIPVYGKIIIKQNQKAVLKINDENHVIETESTSFVEKSSNHPIDENTIVEKISSLGNTIYIFKNLEIDLEENCFLPIKELKEMRRKAFDCLNKKRIERKPVEKSQYFIDVKDFPQEKNINLHLMLKTEKIDSKFHSIYVENDLFDCIQDKRKIKRLPRIVDECKEEDNVLISDLGSLYICKKIMTDFSFNVTNSYTLALLHSLGVQRVTLSYELKPIQVKHIIDAYHERYQKHPNVEVIIQGKLESMITKYDLYQHFQGNGNLFLKDKYQNKFEIKRKENYNVIYHFEQRNDKTDYFSIGVNNIRLEEI